MKIGIHRPLWFSEIGRKDNQEDFLWPSPQDVVTSQRIFIMCDGMGGHEHGEVASKAAATALGANLSRILEHRDGKSEALTEADFQQALSAAYEALDEADASGVGKMGTTMTCLCLHRGGALVAHIGDSRIYHVRPSLHSSGSRNGIVYQSEDHSLLNSLLRAGELTEEEAVNFKQKNVITRAMQPHQEQRSKADIYNLTDIQAGDYFFLCCDGVLEQLTNDRLGAILADTSLDDAEKLHAIQAECDGKTKDNYTCWLIHVADVTCEEGDAMDEEDDEVSLVDDVEEPESLEPETALTSGGNTTKKPRKSRKKTCCMSCLLFLLVVLVVAILSCVFVAKFAMTGWTWLVESVLGIMGCISGFLGI